MGESPNPDAPRRYEGAIASGGELTGLFDVLALFPPIGFALAALCFVVGAASPSFVLVIASLVVVALRAFARGLSRALASKTAATMSVEDDALVVERAGKRVHRVPLWTLRSGRVLPSATTNRTGRLELEAAWGHQIALHFRDPGDARAVLRDLKLSARERPATFAFFFGLRITVGADGILMDWPLLRRRRFVAYSKIVSMTHSAGVIVFRLAGGARYEIMTTTSKREAPLEQHDALVERIEDACSAYRAENAEPPLWALARSGRTALGWVKDLRALSETSGTGYRAATLPTDALWSVALDPAANEELRIGASLALRGALDDDGRAKLRVAAEASASPKLRVVLEAAADELEDEALGAAIAERR